jgi:predicted transcriptional regulator
MQKPTATPRRTNTMQVKMFRADKMEDLEAKVNAWLNEHGAKIDIEHTQTIAGSEARDDAKQRTFYAVSIWYYDIAKG